MHGTDSRMAVPHRKRIEKRDRVAQRHVGRIIYTNPDLVYGATSWQRVLGKLAGADIRMICPAHGPIWRENLPYILEKYDR